MLPNDVGIGNASRSNELFGLGTVAQTGHVAMLEGMERANYHVAVHEGHIVGGKDDHHTEPPGTVK